MAIQVGDTVPGGNFKVKTADGIDDLSTDDLFNGKKVVMFSLPGAFTPTCSAKHLPGYVGNAEALKGKGVDEIACLAVNDAFVMGAWGDAQGAGGKVTMLADGSGDYTQSLGMELDLSGLGLGVRGKRFAMVVDNGTVTHIAEEPNPGELDVSAAEKILEAL
jgi:peroxiredoxin